MSAPLKKTDRPLKIDLEHKEGLVLLRLHGSASMELCADLQDVLVQAAEDSPAVVVADLSDLDFICSTGLGALVAAHIRASNHGGQFRLAAPNEDIRDLLDLTRLSTLLATYDTVDAAVTHEA